MPLRLAVTFSIRAVARVWNDPRPVRYASRTPSSPTILPPVGRSGPGTNRISSSSVASGIAVGMATNMAPHNLVEVVAAARHLVAHPDATTSTHLTLPTNREV